MNDTNHDSSLQLLEDICSFFNIAHFGIFLLLEIAALWMGVIRLTADRSAWITLGCYTLCMLARFINWVYYLNNGKVPEDETNVNIVIAMVDMIASIVIWLVLYFFIFEMNIVKDKLLSQTPEEYRFRNSQSLKARLIVMISMSALSLIILAVHLMFMLSNA